MSESLPEISLPSFSLVSEETKEAFRIVYSLLSDLTSELPISYVDTFLVLQVLEAYYEPWKAPPAPKMSTVISHVQVGLFRHYARFASAAYGWKLLYGLSIIGGPADVARCMTDSVAGDHEVIMKHTGIPEDAIRDYVMPAEITQPSFLLLRDDATESLVVSIRGTMSIADSVTDLVCKPVPFLSGYAHEGMLTSAQWFMDEYLDTLTAELAACPDGYSLEIVGHSLGAGIAILLALLLDEHLPHLDVHATAFAPPCVLSPSLADLPRTQRLVDSIVNGADFVSCLSLGSVERLRALIVLVAQRSNHSKLERIVSLFKSASYQTNPVSMAEKLGLPTNDSDADADADADADPAAASSSTTAADPTAAADANSSVYELHLEAMEELEQGEQDSASRVLIPGGRMFHIFKLPSEPHHGIAHIGPEYYQHIRVRSNMFASHMPNAYEAAIQDVLLFYSRTVGPQKDSLLVKAVDSAVPK